MRIALAALLVLWPALAAAGTLDDPECNFYPSLYDRQNCERWGDPPPRTVLREEARRPRVTVIVPPAEPALDPDTAWRLRQFLDERDAGRRW